MLLVLLTKKSARRVVPELGELQSSTAWLFLIKFFVLFIVYILMYAYLYIANFKLLSQSDHQKHLMTYTVP